ncbi:unnamed protein product [Echinostoma caproni]|uniref:CUB domain-containing protein n=1 Tax=Echinostoma caproni TaxID=27848 RepID=A0A183A7V5_9TREM|nr:unnamed protein product [Echinostoma caproni]
MYIKIYISNSPESDDGFQLEYKEVDVPVAQDCPKSLNLPKPDSIVWPELDKVLSPDCTFNFQFSGPEASRIDAFFPYVRLPQITDCGTNYFQVGDGVDVNSTETKYCGVIAPMKIRSSENKLHINIALKNLPWGNLVHFIVKVVKPFLCKPTVQTNVTGIAVNATGNGFFIPTQSNCTQMIQSPAGKYIQLTFMELQLGTEPNCTDSFVQVGPGQNPLEKPGPKYCNLSKPDTVLLFNVSEVYLVLFDKAPLKTDRMSFIVKEELYALELIPRDAYCSSSTAYR